MITLITGVPGSGKTLYALNLVEHESKSRRRKVFYSGIRDLTLPWTLFGEQSADSEKPEETDASLWYELPVGAIIVIDEAQRLFRPRGTGGKVPETVAMLETHRHKGYDIFLITQHPMLIDSNIRRLVGRHYHVIRRFGGHRAVVSEWSSCTEISKGSIQESIRHDFRYPVDSFGWYKSAEIHTHKKRVPARMYFFYAVPVILIVVGFVGWKAISAYVSGSSLMPKMDAMGKVLGPVGAAVPGGIAKGGIHLSKAEWLDQYAPRVSDLSYSAPVYDSLTQVTRVPVPAACVASAKACTCFSQDSTPLLVMEPMCREIVKHGLFIPFEVDKQKRQENNNVAAAGPGAGQNRIMGGSQAGNVVGDVRAGVALDVAPPVAGVGGGFGVAGPGRKNYGAGESLPGTSIAPAKPWGDASTARAGP